MPTLPNEAASTALPQPPSTSQNVPRASAAYFVIPVSFAWIFADPVRGGTLSCVAGLERTGYKAAWRGRSPAHPARGDPAMKAWRLHEYGKPRDVLRLEEVPDPTPGPGEVRVRVAAI